jgi:hypothetical protein
MYIDVDLRQESIKYYQWYSPDIYDSTMKNLHTVRERMNEQSCNENVVKEMLEQLKNYQLPFYK